MATKSETNFIGPKNHVARRRSLSRRRIVPVTLLLYTYKRSVSTAGSDAIRRLVQLLCGSTITRGVRYQRCIMLKTLQKITSDSEFTAYLVDVAEDFQVTDADTCSCNHTYATSTNSVYVPIFVCSSSNRELPTC